MPTRTLPIHRATMLGVTMVVTCACGGQTETTEVSPDREGESILPSSGGSSLGDEPAGVASPVNAGSGGVSSNSTAGGSGTAPDVINVEDDPATGEESDQSNLSLDACEGEDLYVRIRGAWFAGGLTELRAGCKYSPVDPYPRPTAFHRGQLNGYQVVIEACAEDRVAHHVMLEIRGDGDGEQSFYGSFDVDGDELRPSVDVDSFVETEPPVPDWNAVSSSTPPSNAVYRGSAHVTLNDEVDAVVEFSVCHVANLRSIIAF